MVSGALPLALLISPTIMSIAAGIVCTVALITFSVFIGIDSYEKGKLEVIKQTKKDDKEVPVYPKNTKGLLAMNITNKLASFCVPPGGAFLMMAELTPVVSMHACVIAGLVCSLVGVSAIFLSQSLERRYDA